MASASVGTIGWQTFQVVEKTKDKSREQVKEDQRIICNILVYT